MDNFEAVRIDFAEVRRVATGYALMSLFMSGIVSGNIPSTYSASCAVTNPTIFTTFLIVIIKHNSSLTLPVGI